MKLLTAQEMRMLDQISIERDRIPSIELMQNAGHRIFEIVKKKYKQQIGKQILIVCGPGNNGGDGLVVAKDLWKAKIKAQVFILASPQSLKGDPLIIYKSLSRQALKKVHFVSSQEFFLKIKFKPALIIDALFGTGYCRPITGLFEIAIKWINSQKVPIVSVDMPSGLHADTGEVLGSAVQALDTITFEFPKRGLFVANSREYTGVVHVVNIGLSSKASEEIKPNTHLITSTEINSLLKPRSRKAHKGSLGHAFIMACSSHKMGAGIMTTLAALKAGAGLATLILPQTAYTKIDPYALEIMYEPISDSGKGYFCQGTDSILSLLDKASVLALGPGLGVAPKTIQIVHQILSKYSGPAIVDADGLNALAHKPDILKKRKGPTLLTPHPAEMARLTHLSTADILKDSFKIVSRFAQRYNVHVLLKGYRSILGMPDGSLWINPTGGPHMATAGQGDVLTGIYAGLISEFGWTHQALVGGCFLHGLASDILAKHTKARVVLATEVINNFSSVWNFLRSDRQLLSKEFY